MTEKEKIIVKREKQLDKLKTRLCNIAEKAKQMKQTKKIKSMSEINKIRRKFRTAKNRLQRLRDADVIEWEKRRKKVRDSVWDIRGAIDRLNMKIK